VKHTDQEYQHTAELIASLPERDQHELRLRIVKMLMTVQPGGQIDQAPVTTAKPALRVVKTPAPGRPHNGGDHGKRR
jgi:hypothetical protein